MNLESSKPSAIILCLALLAALCGCATIPKTLISAVESGNAEQVDKLLTKSNVNAKNSADRTPLHIAVSRGNKEITELLLAKGANVNAKDIVNNTPLHDAVLGWGGEDIAELIIAKGADVNARSRTGDTPLHWAVSRDNYGMAELLIAKGADVNARNARSSWLGGGRTPLGVAVLHNNKNMAELLIAKGADINTKDHSGNTLVHQAATDGNKEMVIFLIDKGGDINAKDFKDSTPLHLAVKENDKEMTVLLIFNGSEIDARNQYGSTPLHIALEQGNQDIAELLISKGANAEIKKISVIAPSSVTAKRPRGRVAADLGFYGYLGYGMTMYSDAPVGTASGFRFGAGYHFNRHISIEAGSSDSATGGDCDACKAVTVSTGVFESKKISSSTQYFAVVGALPLNERVEMFLKLGQATASLSYSSTIKSCFLGICSQPQTVFSNASQNSTMYGIGWQWHGELNPNLHYRVEYENFGSVKMIIPVYNQPSTTTNIGISAISLGIFYNF